MCVSCFGNSEIVHAQPYNIRNNLWTCVRVGRRQRDHVKNSHRSTNGENNVKQNANGKVNSMKDRMLQWFDYAHLPAHLQAISRPFGELANLVCDTCEPGPERTVALRKLLEAKDAAVRSLLKPGG